MVPLLLPVIAVFSLDNMGLGGLGRCCCCCCCGCSRSATVGVGVGESLLSGEDEADEKNVDRSGLRRRTNVSASQQPSVGLSGRRPLFGPGLSVSATSSGRPENETFFFFSFGEGVFAMAVAGIMTVWTCVGVWFWFCALAAGLSVDCCCCCCCSAPSSEEHKEVLGDEGADALALLAVETEARELPLLLSARPQDEATVGERRKLLESKRIIMSV